VHRYVWSGFEALPYPWGEDRVSGRAQLDGAIISISKNLEAALRSLRNLPEHNAGMTFWIDALCNNQEDAEERHKQVKRMKDICGKARTVVVWLGEEADESEAAIALISQIDNLAQKGRE
jgi:hypothetical protein